MKILLIITALMLTACSSNDEQIATTQSQANYNACQANYYAASEVVKITLKDDGSVASMSVGNQNLKACQMAQAPESAMVATVKVFGSVANTALNVAASSIPYVAMSKIAVDGIKHAGGNVSNVNSGNTSSANISTVSSTNETINGIKAGNDVDQSQQNQNNPITDDNSVVTDDNSSVVTDDNSNNSVVTTQLEEPVVEVLP